MIDLGFQKSIKLSTDELPGVILKPAIEFEFNMLTTIEWNARFYQWFADEANTEEEVPDHYIQEMKDLAVQLLLSVKNSSGDLFELGTIESVDELVESTEILFLKNVLRGWWVWAMESRLQDKKK